MSESQHVGPIIFADETARGQLESEGEVVTFRASKRTTGETWWRTSRTGPKEGDVLVEEIGPADPARPCSRMERYADLSGFDSLADWQAAIEELNGGLGNGYLYRASVLDGDSDA
ncbi:hypothetical protein ACFQGT_00065 [Natrialbaceae archaeon GCM10025810]